MIGILNIEKSGNLFSLNQALDSINADYILISKIEDFTACDKIIIPGVGSYNNSMRYLRANYDINRLISILKSKKVLGICVGMQILTDFGYENEKTKGLGLVGGEVKKINNRVLPHVGFNSIKINKPSLIFNGLENFSHSYYFTHSYEIVGNNNFTSSCNFFGKKIIASIEKDNFFGVQFHPENSRIQGIKILKNFINL